jgi:hypothetical protein
MFLTANLTFSSFSSWSFLGILLKGTGKEFADDDVDVVANRGGHELVKFAWVIEESG